ncbi:bifunctional ornithine acetyltransferase/N-acetylglutamate synthase [Cytobacillus spongiae]|uniref:bifunctional ornithine acetyltransferase/N-acetylglutamate synthase n=1 Tax=Cytobacillus spongiae TaxID=2901381 RepID=UPI003D7A72F3
MNVMKVASAVKEIVNGDILSPKGFKAAGIHAGLRYSKKDLGIIISDVPANSAAVFTTNQFQAAPLKVTQESLKEGGVLQAVVVNSACANACTGERGMKDAYEMRRQTAAAFNLIEHQVAVASTGVIGEYLPMEKVKKGILSLTPERTENQAEAFQTAILTTDTVMKKCSYSVEIEGGKVVMGGAAKGSGMIHPSMATMLAFITTDVNITSSALHLALKQATEHTFNQITVDGDTSTNDMVLVMANGKANQTSLTEDHPDWMNFIELLTCTCENLAKQIARDGEGATKLVEVCVKGAKTNEDARVIAKQIIGSNLVKTAIYGSDANWGRIIGAIGQSDVKISTQSVDISIGTIQMLKKSEPLHFSEEEARAYLLQDTIEIIVDLHEGEGIGRAWGCDLSYDYVKINASYRT